MSVYFILIFQQLIGSGTHIVSKVMVGDVDPVTLTMLRSLIAAVGFLIISFFRKTIFKFDKSDYPMIFFLAVLAIYLNQFVFLSSLKFTTPANASLLYATTPTMVLILSYFFFNEKLTFTKTLGIAVALLGILLVVFDRGIDLKSEYTLGNLMLIGAVLSWSMYTVFGKKLILKYGAFKTSSATMILGSFIFLPFGMFGVFNFDFSNLDTVDIGGILYLGLGTSLLGYGLWYYALGKIDTSKVAIFTNLQPVITTILSVVLLGTTITPIFVIGGVIAICGVILTQFG
ncbi:MAG: EamA family transporter [Bacteroidota bacterium]|nr:EamA family transporter [Bacteroidota bacterium]